MTTSHSHLETSLVDRMNEAGKKFLNSLSSDQKEKGSFSARLMYTGPLGGYWGAEFDWSGNTWPK